MRKRISKSTWLALCIVALGALGFGFEAQRSRQSKRARLPAPNNLKQIGLAFRVERNSLSSQFAVTGEVTSVPAR